MQRLVVLGTLLLSLAAVASCAIGINRVFMADQGVVDARIILQGMKQAPLRPGDVPVDIEAE